MLVFIRIFAKIRFLQEVRSWKPEVFRSKIFILLFTYSPAFTTRFFSVIAMSEEWTKKQSIELFQKIETIITQKKELKQTVQSGLEITIRFSFHFSTISLCQFFKDLESLKNYLLWKQSTLASLAPKNLNQENWLKHNI